MNLNRPAVILTACSEFFQNFDILFVLRQSDSFVAKVIFLVNPGECVEFRANPTEP